MKHFAWRRPKLAPGRRVYAIGDVHGRYDLVIELLSRISAEQSSLKPARTTVLFIGDLIDRGPQSAQVLKLIGRSMATGSKVIALKGNHEETLVEAWRGDRDALAGWLAHGGIETLESFGVDRTDVDPDRLHEAEALIRRVIPVETIDWLDALPLSWTCGDYLFVHAGIRPGIPLDRQEASDLLWIRDEFLDFEAAHDKIVVHGHTVTQGVEFRPNRIGIDTGAYHTNRLSALCLWGAERRVIATDRDILDLDMEV
jgi:serine/threonine protein phosphatase 1